MEKQTLQYISMCFISLAKQLWPSYMGKDDDDDDDDENDDNVDNGAIVFWQQ